MVKSKKTQGSQYWYEETSVKLNDIQKRKIVDGCLGIDLDDESELEKVNKVTRLIEVYLGSYEGAVDVLNKAPRPTNYIAELEGTEKNKDGTNKDGLRRQTYDFIEELSSMSDWMRREFEDQGYPLDDFISEVAEFFDACNVVRRKYEGQSSFGSPSKKAQTALINTLRQIFYHFYSTPEPDCCAIELDNRGLKDKEKAEIMFIRRCLEIKSIECPKTDRALRKLFYDDSTPDEKKVVITRC